MEKSKLDHYPVAPIGSEDAYLRTINGYPLLSAEEETELAMDYKNNNNLESARKLVLANMRLVVSVARGYYGYGLPQADLVQEGTIGLMKAVKNFDPYKGVRLVTYAMLWIKAEMHNYILNNWRIVKIATTKAQRKLFFKLRSSIPEDLDFTSDLAYKISMDLNVPQTEVVEMHTRFSGGDVYIDADQNENSGKPCIYALPSGSATPEESLINEESSKLEELGLTKGLASLDERSRDIIMARWASENPLTLADLAEKYGISLERVRQIEKKAMEKLKEAVSSKQN